MSPLLLKFSEEMTANEKNVISYILRNVGDAVVLNGEYNGFEIKEVLQNFGKKAFGENGINTSFFRSKDIVENLISRIEPNLKTAENGEDTVIYPFGVVNGIISDNEIKAENLKLNGRTGIYEEKSFMIVFAKENDFLLSDFDSTVRVLKGYAVFVPAKMRLEITGEAEIILIHL
jgi:hypothetical protein